MIATVDSITRKGAYEPFDLQVARGHVFGHQPVRIYGISTAVGSTAFGPLWEGLTSAGGDYAYPSAAAQLTLASTSTSDGPGLSVQVFGLDANFNPISEVVALNGTTNVNTVNSYLRVNEITVANGSNVGVITAKIGTATYAQINAGIGRTQMGIYTVPNGFTLALMKVFLSSDLSGSAYVQYQRYQKNNLAPNLGRLVRTAEGVFVTQLPNDYREAPVLVPAGTDLQFQVKASTGTTNVVSLAATGVLFQADQPLNSYPL